jgi:hypothetical protein
MVGSGIVRWLRETTGPRRLRHFRFPQHGLFIFLVQIGLLLFVPIADTGTKLTPGIFAIVAQATAVATIFLLGYRRVALIVGIVATVALGWAAIHVITLERVRLPPAIVLIGAYVVGVYLCVQHAFLAGVQAKQRIYCGCAGFLMIGMVFASVHAVAHITLGCVYSLPEAIEGVRDTRWIDFVWLSYATLTTAGYTDMVPVGGLPLLLCTLEGLCGILYPATLIARIASLPADDPARHSK